MQPNREQLAVADEVLERLSTKFNDCVLAGGAPRDWYMGLRAKDLDFFVHGHMSKEVLSDLLEIDMNPVAKGHYDFSPFEVLEGWHQGGEWVQIIFLNCPTIERIKEFPANCSKIWYSLKRGGIFEWDYTFEYFSELGVIVMNEEGDTPEVEAYLAKILDKPWHRDRHFAWSRDDFLRSLGRGRYDVARDGLYGLFGAPAVHADEAGDDLFAEGLAEPVAAHD